MPSIVDDPTSDRTIHGGHPDARPRICAPLEYTGSLEHFTYNDLTPVIGREYYGVQIVDLLGSKESDRLIQDLGAVST